MATNLVIRVVVTGQVPQLVVMLMAARPLEAEIVLLVLLVMGLRVLAMGVRVMEVVAVMRVEVLAMGVRVMEVVAVMRVEVRVGVGDWVVEEVVGRTAVTQEQSHLHKSHERVTVLVKQLNSTAMQVARQAIPIP